MGDEENIGQGEPLSPVVDVVKILSPPTTAEVLHEIDTFVIADTDDVDGAMMLVMLGRRQYCCSVSVDAPGHPSHKPQQPPREGATKRLFGERTTTPGRNDSITNG